MLNKIKNFFVAIYQYLIRNPLGILIGCLVLTVMIALTFFRKKSISDLNIGGIFGWAMGSTAKEKGSVDEGQVYVTNPGGDKPEVITPAEILPPSSSPFRDKEKITIKTPEGDIREIRLPKGVRDTDVVEIIEIAPKKGGVTKVLVEKKPAFKITDDDLKILMCIFSFGLCLLIPPNLQAQDCPAGYKCIPEPQAVRIQQALVEYKCLQDTLENKLISLKLSPIQIVETEKKNLYVPGEQEALLEWCSYKIKFVVPLTVQVSRKAPTPPPTYGLRFRFRLGAMASYPREQDNLGLSLIEPYLGLESIYWRLAHLNTHLGVRTGGVGLGIDLTKNLDLNVAVGVRWADFTLTPTIGLSLALY
jgi:hypothetical protein